MPDPPLFGERVCVFAELKNPGDTLELPDLVEHLLRQGGVSKELLPERLEVLDELPRSSGGGKIAKGQLRETIHSILERS